MKDKIEFLYYSFLSAIRTYYRKLVGIDKYKRNNINGKKIQNIDEINLHIYENLVGKSPFLVARFGDAELRCIVYYLQIKYGLRKDYPENFKKIMHNNTGFFPATTENLNKFSKLMIKSVKEVNVFAVWHNYLEDYVIKKFNNKCCYTRLESIEPYRSSMPWSKSLEGKKVLIVHPFKESIEKQLKQNRKYLFNNKNVLPEFEFNIVKAVQSNAGGEVKYKDWFEALEYMYNETLKYEYDIAIIGCGSYGLPLAAKLKANNKKVIHLAGATQILFGIKGKRWEEKPEVNCLFNEYWIRPNQNEKPKNAKKVEGGCYW